MAYATDPDLVCKPEGSESPGGRKKTSLVLFFYAVLFLIGSIHAQSGSHSTSLEGQMRYFQTLHDCCDELKFYSANQAGSSAASSWSVTAMITTTMIFKPFVRVVCSSSHAAAA